MITNIGMTEKTKENFRHKWLKEKKLNVDQIEQHFKSNQAFYDYINKGRKDSDYVLYEKEFQKFLDLTGGKKPCEFALYL